MKKGRCTQVKKYIYSTVARMIRNNIRIFFSAPIEYGYTNFSIKLPANHMLPAYQQAHKKYDRFLPHLAKYMNHLDTIIDVGANVGDTLAGMVEQNPEANYICIEPDDLFYQYLEENIERIKIYKMDLKIRTIKALIGKNVSSVTLEGNKGTKHATGIGTGNIASVTLDEIISQTSYDNIRLLKTDVDGFDYDVLDSSISAIEKHKPMIFFECQFDYEYQKNGYAKTFSSLSSAGYCDWTIFDNFGEVILRTDDIAIIMQLLDYVWKQNSGLASRAIYYYDVLAVQQNDSKLIDSVLKEYT
ncbi:MAG: FkbM family methyltransferase [Rhodospirillales bacterium]|nr:FkbM family methyltransferase [Rhodospirillales bacterium]